MKQMFLKFPNKLAADKFLEAYTIIREEDRIAIEGYSIDVIGEIYDIVVNGDEVTSTAKDGWHVNMLAPDNFVSEYEVFPTTPSRIFGGWEVIHDT